MPKQNESDVPRPVHDSAGVVSGYAGGGIFTGVPDVPYVQRMLWTHTVNSKHDYKLTLRCTRCGNEVTRWAASDNYSSYENTFFCKHRHWLGAPLDHVDCGLGCSKPSLLGVLARAIGLPFTRQSLLGFMVVTNTEKVATYLEPGERR